jgi:hypothetical protein
MANIIPPPIPSNRSSKPPKGAGLKDYLKEAFLFRWNLLFFLGGLAGAAIGPLPDVTLPLLVAGELAYLAALTSLPRFRAAIDARSTPQKGQRPAPRPQRRRWSSCWPACQESCVSDSSNCMPAVSRCGTSPSVFAAPLDVTPDRLRRYAPLASIDCCGCSCDC